MLVKGGIYLVIKDFDVWIKRFNLSNEAILQIQNARNSEPQRKVKSNGRNVPGFYPSKKMGVTIQFESHKLELAGIYEMEHDKNVLEYYDQPPSFTINYDNPAGSKKKSGGHRYTADFFVIENDWIGWVEWKTDEELIKLSHINPNRYTVDESGQWRCPPAERYAEQFGLSFRIMSSRDIDWTYQRNIRFLEDFLLDEKPYVEEKTRNNIKNMIGEKLVIQLDDLLSYQNIFTADDIYTMIAIGEIYVDIYKYLIVDFDKFPLFADKETYHAYLNMQEATTAFLLKPTILNISVGNKIQWDAKVWTIINVGENVITLLNGMDEPTDIPRSVFENLIKKGAIAMVDTPIETEEEEEVLKIIRGASEKELEKANRQYHIVQGMLNGGSYADFDTPDRTIRNWVKKYKDAEKVYGNGYVGLISRRADQGNRTLRFQKDVIELMDKYIDEDYESIIQKQRLTVYNAFAEACKNKGYSPPCYKTFCERVKERPIHEQTKKRKGPKASYNTEPFYFELDMTTPRHGDMPFQIGHIDHTELDIELICSQSGENLGRPWITFLVDAFSRRILAFYLTFDPPSYRSCMMVKRECVRRHGRLPKVIVVDGGKEFHSVYFDTLLARYNLIKKVRPGAKPKFGSVCERLFGTTNEVFIHNLLGNTQIMKNVRQVTKEVNPKVHAVWTLEDLYKMMEKWCYEVYDTMPHSTLDDNPRQVFIKRIAKTGERKNTYIKYDETFKMLTLPTTKKGTAKVKTGQGVKINYFYYWAEDLLHPLYEEKDVPIRYDPYNIGVAYAYINDYWTTLISHHHNTLRNRTEKELKIATAEIRKKKKLFGLKKSISSSEIVGFLQSAESYEKLNKQRLKDDALRNTFTVINGGKDRQDKRLNVPESKSVNVNQPSLKVVEASPNVPTHKNILQKMKEQNSFKTFKEL
jgi:putative transposase